MGKQRTLKMALICLQLLPGRALPKDAMGLHLFPPSLLMGVVLLSLLGMIWVGIDTHSNPF